MVRRDRPDASLILNNSTQTQTRLKAKGLATQSVTEQTATKTDILAVDSDQSAVDENGALKDADQMQWYNSESDKSTSTNTSNSDSLFTNPAAVTDEAVFEAVDCNTEEEEITEGEKRFWAAQAGKGNSAMLLIKQPSFRHLIFHLQPKLTENDLPHHTALTKAIKDKHELLIEQDIDMIKGIISLISMTFDGWSKKHHKAFESLTIHFIQAAAHDPRD
ncbi:hypothetical protein K435DRAFT_866249 [Dendrothele bispora CBS 962.96]|uniref:Uncharacterized protein n=1 Tax=Dendrothele bispora (strain CBS 962.96) TaxID=1314807 RepID=A0A4S8LIR5_DENBC|nr:hypothetical protein K435DRAFT_866249 [Dendrothele bispora CBS 962.96]